jgi:hypothetical protein
MKKLLLSITTAGFIAGVSTTAAEARNSDSRPYSHFATGQCKRASCYSSHPGGTYRFPYHYGHRR